MTMVPRTLVWRAGGVSPLKGSLPQGAYAPRTPAWFLIALLPGALSAQEANQVIQKQGPATLTIEARVDKGRAEIALAAVVPLTLALEGGPGLEVEVPKKFVATDVWHLRPQGPPQTSGAAADRQRWQQSFLLDPLVPGEVELRLEPLRFRENQGEWQTVKWQPIKFLVTQKIPHAESSQLRDITSIEELPPEQSIWEHWPWAAGSAGLLAVGALAAWWFWRRQRSAIMLRPDQWALRELDRLESLKLPERGAIERYHTLLANVLRGYLEKRFAVRARRQTTPEFLRAAAQIPELTDGQRDALRDFLERCDLAKFARASVDAQQCQALSDSARDFVKQTSAHSEAGSTAGD